MTEPVTEKRTVMPGVGFPNWSFTVAVTQCCASTVLVAVFGASVSVEGLPGTTVRLTVSTAVVGPPGVRTAVIVQV